MMHDIGALYKRIVSYLLTLYINNKENTRFEKIILYFFETSLVHFLEKEGIINTRSRITTKRQSCINKYSSILVSSLFEDEQYNVKLYTEIYKFVCELIDNESFYLADIGELFEALINLEYDSDNLKESIKRSDLGMYFTNPLLVHNSLELMLRKENRKELLNRKYIDPAMGAGAFVFGLLNIVRPKTSEQQFRSFIVNNIYGVDKDPVVVDIFKLTMIARYNLSQKEYALMSSHFIACDSLLTPLEGENSWAEMFPDVFSCGGYDCVIGNPPWGKIKCNVREYYLINSGLTQEFQGNDLKKRIEVDEQQYHEWEKYQKYIKGYSKLLKESVNFNHQQYIVDGLKTGGDSDLYKYFLELSVKLMKKNGIMTFIIPASFYLSEGATGLRHFLLENGTIEYLLNFENKRHIFAIHPSFKFIVLVYRYNQKPGEIKKACFDLLDVGEIEDARLSGIDTITYSRKFLDLCSKDYWAIPECKNTNERDILEKLFIRYPILGKKEKNLWNISFNREFDMTLDSEKFQKVSEVTDISKYFPLYEGRMVHQFNSSKKKYVKGTGRTAVWDENRLHDGEVSPQFYINKKDCPSSYRRYRAAYCEITGQKNVRTVLASLIGPEAVCGNKVPTISFDNDSIELHLYWIGVANSFVLDWIIRKKITTTLNYYHWMNVPFPRISATDERFIAIAALTTIVLGKISGLDILEQINNQGIIDYINQNYNLSLEKLRLLIDVFVADLYGISSDEMVTILYNFKSLDLGAKGIEGDLKYESSRKTSYVTRDKLIYEMRKREKKNLDVSIVEIFYERGIDISKCTGKLKALNKRVQYYNDHNIYAYQE